MSARVPKPRRPLKDTGRQLGLHLRWRPGGNLSLGFSGAGCHAAAVERCPAAGDPALRHANGWTGAYLVGAVRDIGAGAGSGTDVVPGWSSCRCRPSAEYFRSAWTWSNDRAAAVGLVRSVS